MKTMESIREWFMECPAIKSIVSFNTNYLGENVDDCSLYPLPSPLNHYEDIAGNIEFFGTQTLNFLMILRAPYGDDVHQNIDNLEFFDQVKDWMYEQNTKHNFPIIAEGKVKTLLPVKTEYLSVANADTAAYELRCALTYWRE